MGPCADGVYQSPAVSSSRGRGSLCASIVYIRLHGRLSHGALCFFAEFSGGVIGGKDEGAVQAK